MSPPRGGEYWRPWASLGGHDGGGIQIHGAGAGSDHAAAKSQVPGGEAVDAAEELVPGVVLVEEIANCHANYE